MVYFMYLCAIGLVFTLGYAFGQQQEKDKHRKY